ncbi:phosphoenolpyruvate--protein phosphotransferase [Alkaliphilus hydrothermalis]|uniref:Phosphoenolpyruvate-protein phosphotransferase n=1 Tax=Alkaliphilus hydrothermalis TaxID=1482730 RepID=A0ABS2NTX7_9FIRM|nr:phosphoenolpyruvate--protein phosphotransferase [Alkaliphilus hydrothermalis]MBM7616232.1 phosphotransferase system enzyme I (PtsI) [Alkaliphilus hydrothermalis]
MLQGIGASPGLALGKVLILDNEPLTVEKQTIEDIEVEEQKLLKAVATSKEEIEKIKEKAHVEFGAKKAEIFDAHLMILEDPELISGTTNKIKQDRVDAAYGLRRTAEEFINIFEAMDNEYMRERVADIRDVTDRVIRNIKGVKTVDLSVLEEEVILVAHDLTPSETATMDKERVIGFLTNIGGKTSHTAIMARSLEIPAVVGLVDITENLKTDDFVILDGEGGKVILNPTEEIVKLYQQKKNAYKEERKALEKMKGKESVTKDGQRVQLAGNIGTPNDLAGLQENDAEGVGLFRTEFLYMNRDTMPSEEEQFQAYKKVLETMNPKPIVIRTLDIGGDKNLSYLKIDKEMNPFLGYRAIRLCLVEQEFFKTQLRAILRASVYGNLKIMFPMISSIEELLQAKEVLNQVKGDLDQEGMKYASDVEVGIMIEVPSAAIISDLLAKHVDFFSIGTNDLIQYTCAVDRLNEKIHHLYQPFNPAVLRLIKTVIDNGHKAGIWVGMCGEIAGDKRMIPILIGMGLDKFSMSPISILPARKQMRELSVAECEKVTEKVLSLGSAEEIKLYLESLRI